MSRGLWFVAGAGAGIYGMVRGRRAAEALSADGLRDRVNAAVLGARMMGAEVAAGKAERESELRQEMHDRALRSTASRPLLAAPAASPDHPEHHPQQED